MNAADLRGPRLVAAVTALLLLAVGVRHGAWIAGGSDSYCYVEQAERWAAGTIRSPQALDFTPPWADRWLPLAPTGFVPSPTVAGAIAPICPSGLSLTMTPFRWAGGRDAVFLVVPLLGAVLIWATFLLGARLHRPRTGALAAVFVASSPIVLFQVVQPMSDVPAAAWWTLAAWLVARGTPARLALGGLATAAAVLTRPVLAPLGGVLVLGILFRPGEETIGTRVRHAMWFCLGAAPGAVALAWIQHLLYGSALSSGYGSPAALFAAANVGPNAARYARWAVETQTPVLLLAPFALVIRGLRWGASLLLALAAVIVASYLPYVRFDDWSYLRFLLPALPFVLVLVAAVAVQAVERVTARWRVVALAATGLALAAMGVRTAALRHAFDLQGAERKFRVAGEYVRDALPPRAVVLAVWHSGSVRYYGERLTIAWDGFPPQQLDETLAVLTRAGHPPYLLLEPFEEARFRDRFAGASPLAALDWPPAARIGRELRLFNPADRAVYHAGGDLTTANVPLK